MHNKNIVAQGFSLVELSVTLVIIGLVMAAITSGVHLMQAAKLDKVVSEISGYVTAVNNFKDKYKAWPGDMPNATAYWGSLTTNGNGDDHICVTCLSADTLGEPLAAWQQLALSGMIAGKYTGADAGTPDFEPGVNVPGSVMPGTYYFLYRHLSVFSTRGNVLQLGANSSNTDPWGGALTPADSHIIDTKIDDGFASTGNYYSLRGGDYNSAGYCVDAAYGTASANYILTDSTTSCRTAYWLNKE